MYSELNREDFLRSRNFSKSYCVCVRVQNNAMGCGTVGMYSAYQLCIFLVRFINPSRVDTCNTVFWLHSYVTVVVLVVAAVLSNLSSYVGDTIHCLSHYDSEPWTTDQRKLYPQDFCWIYGTQTGTVLTINHGYLGGVATNCERFRCHGRSVSHCLDNICHKSSRQYAWCQRDGIYTIRFICCLCQQKVLKS